MAMLVVAALYVMGGLVFILSMLALFGVLPTGSGGNPVQLLIGSGVMLGLAAIAESLVKISARMK
jgi:hypothetical protein